MSNSIFVPLRRVPASLQEVRHAIHHAFGEFDLPLPEVEEQQPESPTTAVIDSIVKVRGARAHQHCWISFGEYPKELTGADAATHMGDVTTRGSWSFAAIAVLALFEFGGSIAFNDSGELDGQPEYDAAALRRTIQEALASDNEYLAR